MSSRIEVRLSPPELAFLDERLCRRGETLASWLRAKLDAGREAASRVRRMEAAEAIVRMSGDWGPGDWSELKKQLEEDRFSDAW